MSIYDINEIINNKYKFIKKLGSGTYSNVIQVSSLNDEKIYAIKIFNSHNLFKMSGFLEFKILKLLNDNNNHVVNVYELFEIKDQIYIVMEILDKNIYENYILEKNPMKFDYLFIIMKNTLEVIFFLHKNDYIHTDIKPENIMIKQNQDDFIVKIIDFSSIRKKTENTYYDIQTLWYRAPEVLLNQPYTSAIDIWSLGCVIFELIVGEPPFTGDSENDQLETIINCEKKNLEKILKGCLDMNCESSKYIIELIFLMLEIDVKKRITAEDALLFIQTFCL